MYVCMYGVATALAVLLNESRLRSVFDVLSPIQLVHRL